MKKIILITKIFFVYLFLASNGLTKESIYFKQGIEHFQKKEFTKSKIFFERDIVFDPKSEKSYLYLAKIFEIEENESEELKNVNTTLLLDPKNEEALYMLIDIKLERSNFTEVKELQKRFEIACNSLCEKKDSIEKRLKNFDTNNES